MAGVRGRPRKVPLPEPFALPGETMQPEVSSPVVAPLNTAPILAPHKVEVTRERFQHVLDMLKPYAEKGFQIDADSVSITIRKGRASECLNVTCTDSEFKRALNRIAVAAASRGGAVEGE